MKVTKYQLYKGPLDGAIRATPRPLVSGEVVEFDLVREVFTPELACVVSVPCGTVLHQFDGRDLVFQSVTMFHPTH